MTWCQRCTCVQLSSLTWTYDNCLSLSSSFLLQWGICFGRIHRSENSHHQTLPEESMKTGGLKCWHSECDTWGTCSEQGGGEGRKMETPVFIPLETLNLLDSILPTGSSKTDSLPQLAVHTCTLQVPGCTSACSLWLKHWSVTVLAGHLLPNCTPEGCGHHWHVRETAGTIKGTGKSFRGTWLSLGRDGLEW